MKDGKASILSLQEKEGAKALHKSNAALKDVTQRIDESDLTIADLQVFSNPKPYMLKSCSLVRKLLCKLSNHTCKRLNVHIVEQTVLP